MNLGDRCDEILRLIDETLGDLGAPVVGHTAAPGSDETRATGEAGGEQTTPHARRRRRGWAERALGGARADTTYRA